MKRASLTYLLPRWSKEQLARIREIEREFHVRAFGEELARVNLDMTIEERHRSGCASWLAKTASLLPAARSPLVENGSRATSSSARKGRRLKYKARTSPTWRSQWTTSVRTTAAPARDKSVWGNWSRRDRSHGRYLPGRRWWLRIPN